MKQCIKCNIKYPDSQKKCPKCGKPLYVIPDISDSPDGPSPVPPSPSPPHIIKDAKDAQIRLNLNNTGEQSLAVASGLVEEYECQENVTYILRDNDLFYETRFNAMRSCPVCVRCMTILLNNRIQLFYPTAGLTGIVKGLSEYMTEEQYCRIVRDCLNAFLEVKRNGHISCEDIDLSLSRFYLEKSEEGSDLRVRLICLPLVDEKKLSPDSEASEEKIRRNLLNLLRYSQGRDGRPGTNLEKIKRFTKLLSSETSTLEMIFRQALAL